MSSLIFRGIRFGLYQELPYFLNGANASSSALVMMRANPIAANKTTTMQYNVPLNSVMAFVRAFGQLDTDTSFSSKYLL